MQTFYAEEGFATEERWEPRAAVHTAERDIR
jgi:hypothetical protein